MDNLLAFQNGVTKLPLRVDFICRDDELFEDIHSRLERLHVLGIHAAVYQTDLKDFTPKVPSFLVTPGNSFGHMTGGFDQAVCEKFHSYELEDTIQLNIRKGNFGELPVGMATLVFLDEMWWKGLIYAPTMRVPHVLPDGTDVPYVSTRAALLMYSQYMSSQMRRLDKQPLLTDRGLVFTGMGSGTGEVPPEIAAEQMILAIERHFLDQPVRELFVDGMDLHRQLTWWSRAPKVD